MRKHISKIVSTAICTSFMLGTALSVSAEKITIEPVYPLHGNKCGEIIISPQIDREISVLITQITEDGNFDYYNTVIPAGGELTGENDYSIILEGKGAEPIQYKMTIGVPKFKGSTNYQTFIQEFSINDTDYITDEVIEKYTFTYTIERNDELTEPIASAMSEPVKDENNIVSCGMSITFPASDIIPGDVDHNLTVNLYDVIDIAKYVMDKNYLTPDQIVAGDYNQDGTTNLYDAIEIAKTFMT